MKKQSIFPQNSFQQRGQTLVEVMTVTFVLVVGIMGALGLTVANIRNESTGLTRLIASNLSREGIELARSTRDSNWLKDQAWDTGLGTDIDKRCARLDNTSISSFNPVSCSTNQNLQSDVYRVFKTQTGLLIQNSSDLNDVQTAFFRKIEFQPLCNGTGPDLGKTVLCPDWDTKVGLRVISEVGLADSGKFKPVKSIEDLMNWR